MKQRIISFVILAAAAAASQQAQAAGFYLQEQSVSQQGSAFAGAVANPEDASTIFFNPAGMTQLSTPSISGGVSVLVPKTEIRNTGSTAGPTAGAAAAYAGSLQQHLARVHDIGVAGQEIEQIELLGTQRELPLPNGGLTPRAIDHQVSHANNLFG